jgi:hypothetical protein
MAAARTAIQDQRASISGGAHFAKCGESSDLPSGALRGYMPDHTLQSVGYGNSGLGPLQVRHGQSAGINGSGTLCKVCR